MVQLLSETFKKGTIGLIVPNDTYTTGIVGKLRNVLDLEIVATTGGKAGINKTDLLQRFIDDDRISVIVIPMESIRGDKYFVDAVKRAVPRKPVIILRSAEREDDEESMPPYTASPASSDEISGLLLSHGGAILVRDNEHLFALARAFSKQPLPTGNEVLVISHADSLSVAAAESLYLSNMRPATLEPHLQQRLEKTLSPCTSIGDGHDFSFTMTPRHLKSFIEIGIESNNVNSFIIGLHGERLNSYIEIMKDIDYKGKPIVCCAAFKELLTNNMVKMERVGIPVYSTVKMAVEVLGWMYHYGMRRRSAVADSIAHHLPTSTLYVDNTPVRLRLINAKDIDLWTDFVNSCSKESLWMRFLAPFSATPERAKRFCNVDPEEEIAVVAEIKLDNQYKFLGIARLIKNKRREGEAEYAIIIYDPWQNKRLGRILSKQCFELAREKGYKTIRAEAILKNHSMIKIFRHFNFSFDGKEENMISTSLNLS
jgi:GNAT superfamily N-acetyltransferase